MWTPADPTPRTMPARRAEWTNDMGQGRLQGRAHDLVTFAELFNHHGDGGGDGVMKLRLSTNAVLSLSNT